MMDDLEEAVEGRVERTVKLCGAVVVSREQSICAKIYKEKLMLNIEASGPKENNNELPSKF